MRESIAYPPAVLALAGHQRKARDGDFGPLLQPPSPPPVPPFPLDVLPGPVAQFVSTVAFSLMVPSDLVGVPALVALGTAIGTTRAIAPKEG